MGGSYGVNVAGFERYKAWMHKGLERVQGLGPVLGPLHPLVADNIARLKSVFLLVCAYGAYAIRVRACTGWVGS